MNCSALEASFITSESPVLPNSNAKLNTPTVTRFQYKYVPVRHKAAMDDVDAFAAELHREYLNGPISEEGWKQLKAAIGETDNGKEYEWNKVRGCSLIAVYYCQYTKSARRTARRL
jgi:hypothetical protein